MKNNFDVFLPCAKKDYMKLPYVVEAIKKNIDFGGAIHVCAPNAILNGIDDRIMFHQDNEVLDVNLSGWKFRPSWMYQQCLKLFQNVTSDLYLVVDCDTIFNRPVPFFEGDKKIWYTGWAQFNKPYFDFQEAMIGVGKVHPDSFISDTGFYDRRIIQKMLSSCGYKDVMAFISRAQEMTTPTCYMCEQDLYASYCYVNCPDEYVFKPLKMGGISAKVQHDPDLNNWTTQEIEGQIEKMRRVDCDTFSMHSWFVETDGQKEARERIA